MLLADAVDDAFGKITAPAPLANILKQDPSGAGSISLFLTNLITLFYSIAAVVLIFMLLWGAFEWMTSGGEKEKLHAAQQRIMSAIIGIILFAVTFAIITVIGQFTGFEFFKDQNKLFQESSKRIEEQNRTNRNNQIQRGIGPGGGL